MAVDGKIRHRPGKWEEGEKPAIELMIQPECGEYAG